MNSVAENIRSYYGISEASPDDLEHYGVKRRSGRYPWGSGDNPYQRSGDFLSRINELKKSGMTEKEIAEALGFESTGDLRRERTIANHERRRLLVDGAKALKEDGLGATEIGVKLAERYGLSKPISESTIRSYLNPDSEANMNKAEKTADRLKEELKSKGVLDVSSGVELELGVSKGKLQEALDILRNDGYIVTGVSIPQANNPRKRTITKVLCDPDIYETPTDAQRHLYNNFGDIKSVGDYYTVDSGERWYKREYPASISSDRVKIQYGDEGGAAKDGVIELRRGVKDLDLGNSHYAQVRILVDGTHYLKGMAMYSDDIPDGVDIVFNTNKKSGTPKMEVLKPIQDDPDNPFGAYIKAKGQSYYDDPKGKYTDPITGKKQSLSAINKLKEEGDYDDMSRNLSSQFLSKQPLPFIKRQLNLTYSDYEAEYDDIMSCTNPTVKKKLLYDFANECDAATVHMKAAALPRQATRVILPVTQLKETECYAPYLKDGEKVVLVRYPHGGTFEIPELTVNNKNASAKKILGPDTKDAIGINSKVAERLSGADFDGDTVVVIPVNRRVHIQTTPALEGLKDFDPKSDYGTTKKIEKNKKGEEVEVYYNSRGQKIKTMSESYKQQQMGVVSNLITDMTLQGADTNDIVKAVRHSMVVIDAVKHHLDYKQSEVDNDIDTLKKKYQPRYDDNGNLISYGGASSLISKHKQTVQVPERKGSPHIDKETGEVSYSTSGRAYINKKGERVIAKTNTPLLIETKDLHSISSGSLPEEAYADYGNKMKALANRARKEYANMKGIQKSPSAAETYSKEVASLNEKLRTAQLNAPRERRAQALANSTIKAKLQEYPELSLRENAKELAKVRRYALEDARASVGASGKKKQIEITDREWEAIQAGAISDTRLREVLRYSNQDAIRERAMPRTTTTLSPAKISRLQNLRNSGYTIAQMAEALGVSTSTVSKYLNQ